MVAGSQLSGRLVALVAGTFSDSFGVVTAPMGSVEGLAGGVVGIGSSVAVGEAGMLDVTGALVGAGPVGVGKVDGAGVTGAVVDPAVAGVELGVGIVSGPGVWVTGGVGELIVGADAGIGSGTGSTRGMVGV